MLLASVAHDQELIYFNGPHELTESNECNELKEFNGFNHFPV